MDLRASLANASWLSLDHALRVGVGLFVGVALARYLGPAQFGLYSLLLSVAAVAGAIAPFAADAVVAKELISRPSDRCEILGSQALLRALGAGLAFIVAVAVCVALRPSEPQFWALGALAASVLLAQPAEAFSVWFQSQLQAKAVTVAKTGVFLGTSCVRVLLIVAAAPLVAFIVVNALEAALAGGALLVAYRLFGEHVSRWSVSRQRLRALLRDSWPLLLSGVSSMLYLRLDVVMLGSMRSEAEVGVYGAATRISEVWYFIPVALCASLQPMIVRTRQLSYPLYLERLRLLYAGLSWVAVPIAIAVTAFATPAVVFVFGDEYAQAGPVLAVHIWASIAVFLGVASSQFLVAENLTKLSLYRTALGLAVNATLNLFLIPRHGALGAAVATLVSYFVASVSLLWFRASRQQAVFMLRALTPLGMMDAARLYLLLRRG